MPQVLFGINIYKLGTVTLIAKPDEGSINFLRTMANVLGAKLFPDLMRKGVSGIYFLISAIRVFAKIPKRKKEKRKLNKPSLI